MEKFVRYSLLFDFYGDLLTPKQQQFFEMHYNQDMSLAEIGLEERISPQAVSDLLKRTSKILERYENALRLVQKHQRQSELLEEISQDLKQISMQLQAMHPATSANDCRKHLDKAQGKLKDFFSAL
ncbi:MAG: YlxM family DNA-binding protein [Clostridiales bacterium]|jgi:predicted DNA-binding protein YlxM (UPF0122 family)|nr:YlxM family DNA-binding protein [Clostridiales bacterium]